MCWMLRHLSREKSLSLGKLTQGTAAADEFRNSSCVLAGFIQNEDLVDVEGSARWGLLSPHYELGAGPFQSVAAGV